MPHVQLTARSWLCRWDKCWIRLLDGMLQLSVAGTRDYELRIPTRIRSIVINNAAGTDDGQITVRSSLCLHPPEPYHVPSDDQYYRQQCRTEPAVVLPCLLSWVNSSRQH